MKNHITANRAKMPHGTSKILDRRNVEFGNRNLLKHIRKGLSVLDVGCGSGAITKSIAAKVGQSGHVLGIDISEHLLTQAQNNFGSITNLHFELMDINNYETDKRFDLVNAARLLQWLPNPLEVLNKMKFFLKTGGVLAILDYNHEKIIWDPEPPRPMQKFYNAFLKWRSDAGFDNAIADHLKVMLESIEMRDVTVEEQFEITNWEDDEFRIKSRIWSEVAETRGHQLVKDQYISELERLEAIEAYDKWVNLSGKYMKMYLLAVEGTKAG